MYKILRKWVRVKLQQQTDTKYWEQLYSNPNPDDNRLEHHADKINWHFLLQNPSIFTYDYDAIQTRCMIYKEELIKNRFHPRNITKFQDWKIDGF